MLSRTSHTLLRTLRTPTFRPLSTSTAAWANIASEFTVSPTTGFLPRHDPLAVLPHYFEKLSELLHEMPAYKGDGTYGLLHSGRFGERVETELPMYDVGFIFDRRILTALYRDYTFLASAYLLEPCDIQYRLARNYGLARRVLPANIAVPLEIIAGRLGARPFLEHSMSYTFYNYRRKDQALDISVDNIEPIRMFSGCSAEHSYIVAHVAAAQHTGKVVESATNLLSAVRTNDRALFDTALHQYTEAMGKVNNVMSSTLRSSGEYASFRTFLSGSKGQPMFNHGIQFEGSQDSSMRTYFGVAQSSNPVASLSTHLFQLSSLSPQGTLPCSDGIDMHRPANYQAFLHHIDAESRTLNVQRYALADAASSANYMGALDQVLAYRYRQWANLRESMPVQPSAMAVASREGFARQSHHIKDLAGLIHRTLANTDVELLMPHQRTAAEHIAHRADVVRRSLNRVLAEPDAAPAELPVSMIAY
ncbi:hypothetical protein FBU59_000777 [Linderina macrospora]|uniref:Uncharacterized protein n=1 Tax=Linderina macrospora TaxID=4868 RepID=A0ACC1JFT5_9FUNG|nr:hypothetical protein FBU59_000777 [Linderina macrospora]